MRPLGLVEFNTTTPIASTDPDIVSTELQARFGQADRFNGWFANVVAKGTIRRVTDYATTGTLTLSEPDLTTETGNVEVDLSRFHPDDVKRDYNRARQELYPTIFAVKNIETLVTGQRQHTFTIPSTMRHIDGIYLGNWQEAASIAENLLLNPGFENWTSGSADNWTLTGGTGTETQENQTTNPKNYAVLRGSSSAKIRVSISVASNYLSAASTSGAVEGMEANMAVWVYSIIADRVSAKLLPSVEALGSKHTGTGWELLTVSTVVPAGVTGVSGGIHVTAGAGTLLTYYADEALLTLGQSEPADEPWIPLADWRRIAAVDGASNHGLLYIDRDLPEGRRLKIEGRDMLSSVSSDTDTFEVDGEMLDVLYDQCRAYLCEEVSTLGSEDVDAWRARASRYQSAVDRAIQNGVGLASVPTRKLTIPNA